MTRPQDAWPELPLAPWADTLATLHLQSQVVGKIKLRCAPVLPHWWGVTLFVTPTGLTTGSVPHGTRTFEIRFDLVRHELVLDVSDGRRRALSLGPRSVADFHRELTARLREVGCEVAFDPRPVEIPWSTTPLDRDHDHATYDPAAVDRFRRALVQAARVLEVFRSWYVGKVSPVHFFWGSFDLAVSRFSGRRAPPHPGGVPHLADWVTREAYGHELSSAGWWPGPGLGEPAFYSYAWPEPPGFAAASVSSGRYDPNLREYVLPYARVRAAPDPDAVVLGFLQDTWRAAADLGRWDPSLARPPGELAALARRIGVTTPLPPEPVA